MLEGSYSVEQQAAWLQNLRVQVIPYGPTHEDLSGKLAAFNVNSERSYAKRIFLSKSLLESYNIEKAPQFFALLEGAGVSEPDTKLRNAAETLFAKRKDDRSRLRQNLFAMQILTRSMVDLETVKAEMMAWQRHHTAFTGSYRDTVKRAAGALFLFDDTLLNAMKRRGYDIHENVLHGICREMLGLLENMDPKTVSQIAPNDPWYAYEVENMNRILTTLYGILSASPEEVFVDPGVGAPAQDPIEGSLLVLRWDRLELRKFTSPSKASAHLPMEMRVDGGSFERLNDRDVVVAFTRENVIAWDPNLSTPVGDFNVHGPFGINSVDHQSRDGALESIVSTTDGIVYRLKDLRETRAWRPLPEGFLDEVVLLPDERVFALADSATLSMIVELVERGYRDRLTTPQLASQLSRLPLLGDHWKTRVREWAEFFGSPLESIRLEGRFQHPRLGRIAVDGKTLLTLQFQLSFGSTDEVVLLLDPDQDPVRVVGHFLVPDQLMSDFEIQARDSGQLILVASLLSDFKQGYDLAIWARAARTNQGIIFVQAGSTLRTYDDLVYITFANGEMCFAADDSGGLFRFSMGDKHWEEIDRNPKSRIKGLRFLK